MASSVETGALDASRPPVRPLQLRYQVHRGTREIFWASKHGLNHYDSIGASAAYMAVYDGEHLAPEFIGSCTNQANDHTDISGLLGFKIALDHALKTIHRALQDEPGRLYVRVIIYADNVKGLSLLRGAVDCGGLEYFRTWSGRPKPYPAVLEDTFIVHQKIEHMVGRERVRIHYKFPGGNVQPFFDQKVVSAKCNEILLQMQEEYYASRRWNQVSRFLLQYDCNGWLEGYCDRGTECRFRHRRKMVATGIPPRSQTDTGKDEAMPPAVTCKYWAQGKCFKGGACTFEHEGDGGVLERPLCVYWERGECFKGDDCGFRHGNIVPDAEPECAEADLCARLEDVQVGGDSGVDESKKKGKVSPFRPATRWTRRKRPFR